MAFYPGYPGAAAFPAGFNPAALAGGVPASMPLMAAAAGMPPGMPPGMLAATPPGMLAPFAAAPATSTPTVLVDEVRTVFITGFPSDIKERELNNLLRFIPGYEASQMNWKNGQAQGFALFVTAAAARAACDQIAGLCFDDNVLLRAEMAHKNMYIKGEPAPAVAVAVVGKRIRTAGSYTSSYSGGGAGSGGGAPILGAGPVGYAPVSNMRDNPPCNTLFIGNLGEVVDDGELQALFAAQPGFTQIKVLRSGRNVSCFVEFDTVESATLCHTTQQGAVLRSSDRGGIRIQFSKNPFGKKRDASGQLVDARQSGGGGASALDAQQSGGGGGAAAAEAGQAGAAVAAAAAPGAPQ